MLPDDTLVVKQTTDVNRPTEATETDRLIYLQET